LQAGTLNGINAYFNTVRSTERKIYEVQQVNILIKTLTGTDDAARDRSQPAAEIQLTAIGCISPTKKAPERRPGAFPFRCCFVQSLPARCWIIMNVSNVYSATWSHR
jgi:hypothetical protein